MQNKKYGAGTAIGLCKVIREKIKESIKSLILETDNYGSKHRAPKLVNGWLPPKRTDDEPEFPFVIVRPKTGKINNDGFLRVQVRVAVGTYSEEFDGHEYAMIAFQRIVQALNEQPTLDDRYTLEYPLTWELFDEQPYPFWQIVGTLEYIIPVPVSLTKREF